MSTLIVLSLLVSPSSYNSARESSLATGLPLIVYVSCPPLNVPGTIEHYEPAGLSWHRSPAVLIGVPHGDWVEWTDTLSPTADLTEIQEAIRRAKTSRQEVQAAPVRNPFVRPARAGSC